MTLLLLMIHLTREQEKEVEKEVEKEEEESAFPAQLPPGKCYDLSKEILSLFFFNNAFF